MRPLTRGILLPADNRTVEEAISEARKARELDPLSLTHMKMWVISCILQGATPKRRAASQALDLDPNYGVARGTLAKVTKRRGIIRPGARGTFADAPPETVAQMKQLAAAAGN